jgi:hypothetical protein
MRTTPRPTVLTVIACLVAASVTFVSAQTNGTPERFDALGLNTSRSSNLGKPFNFTIYVNRWVTASEFAQFISTLRAEGTDGVLKMLRGRDQMGVLRTPQPLGFPLALAVEHSQPDGGRRVVIISPRRIGETDFNARTLDYPFMVIDMKIPADHIGEGTIAQLARLSIGGDGDQFTVENYEGAKTILESVTASAQRPEALDSSPFASE